MKMQRRGDFIDPKTQNPLCPSSVLDKNQFNMLSSVTLIDINEFTNSGLGLRTSQQSFWIHPDPFNFQMPDWRKKRAEARATLKFSRLYCQFVLGSYQQAHEFQTEKSWWKNVSIFYLFCHCGGGFWNWLWFWETWHEKSNAIGEREKRFEELTINCNRFRLRVALTAPVANQPQISICFGTGFARGLAAGRYFYDFNFPGTCFCVSNRHNW